MTYKNYGKVRILKHVTTNRGGLILILVRLKPTTKFPQRSRNTFWVRAGDVLPG